MNPHALRCTVVVESPEVVTVGPVVVRVLLRNEGAERWVLPRIDRDCPGLRIEARCGERAFYFDDASKREARVGDVRMTPAVEAPLEPGEVWERTFDLATYGPPLPSGDYSVIASYVWTGGDGRIMSDSVALRVVDLELLGVGSVCDLPSFPALSVLFEVKKSVGGARYYFRQYGQSLPGAPWYGGEVAEDDALGVWIVGKGFTDLRSFEATTLRFVLWRSGPSLRARRYRDGRSDGSPWEAPYPEGLRLLPHVWERRDGSLLLCFLDDRGALRAMRLTSGGLQSEPLSVRAHGQHLAVVMCRDVTSVVTWDGRLHVSQTDAAGLALGARSYALAAGPPSALWYDPSRDRLNLTWRNDEHFTIDFASVDLTRATVDAWKVAWPLHEPLSEVHFDRDANGRFHALVGFGESGLFHLCAARPPELVADAQPLYHPVVAALKNTFLGYHLRGEGFSFRRWKPATIPPPASPP